MQGEFDEHLKWPFQGSVVLQLCNQLEGKHHCGDIINFSETRNAKCISRVTSGEMAESGWGIYPTMTLSLSDPTTANISRTTAFIFELLLLSHYQSSGCFQLKGP